MPPFWHHHLPFFFFPHANFTNATHPFFFPHFNSTNATNPFFFPHANSTNTTATGSALNLPAQTTDAELRSRLSTAVSVLIIMTAVVILLVILIAAFVKTRRVLQARKRVTYMEENLRLSPDPASLFRPIPRRTWKQRLLQLLVWRRSPTRPRVAEKIIIERWDPHERKSTDGILCTKSGYESSIGEDNKHPPPLPPLPQPLQLNRRGSSHSVVAGYTSPSPALPRASIASSSISSVSPDPPPKARVRNTPASRWAFINAAQLRPESVEQTRFSPTLKDLPAQNISSTQLEPPIPRADARARRQQLTVKSYFSAASSEIPHSVRSSYMRFERYSRGTSVQAQSGSTSATYSSDVDQNFTMVQPTALPQPSLAANPSQTPQIGRPIIPNPRLVGTKLI